MLVQVVTFRLDGLSDEDFRAACAQQWAAPVAAMPGLLSKTWLANDETNTYGGVYLWADSASMGRYADSDFFKRFAGDSRIVDITSQIFSIIEAPSRLTHGLGVPVPS